MCTWVCALGLCHVHLGLCPWACAIRTWVRRRATTPPPCRLHSRLIAILIAILIALPIALSCERVIGNDLDPSRLRPWLQS